MKMMVLPQQGAMVMQLLIGCAIICTNVPKVFHMNISYEFKMVMISFYAFKGKLIYLSKKPARKIFSVIEI